ncbi:hypothetical protein ACFOLD_14730 [Kocuria carniphila]
MPEPVDDPRGSSVSTDVQPLGIMRGQNIITVTTRYACPHRTS